jgi:hypothetical protein
MATTASPSILRQSSFRVHYIWRVAFVLMALFVLLTREWTIGPQVVSAATVCTDSSSDAPSRHS